MIEPADDIAAITAATHEDSVHRAGAGLADLHIKRVGVQGDLARHGDAAWSDAEIELFAFEAEMRGEEQELAACLAVKGTFRPSIVGNGKMPGEPAL